MENKLVILFFARTAAAEMHCKKLCNKGKKNNALVHTFLYKKSLREIYKTGLPVVLYDETKQRGDSFNSRYINAMQECFNNGYNSVITVGSDCIQLQAADILRCQQELTKGNNVLGPDNRGGIYLMGIQKQQFLNIDFNNVRWHSTNVIAELKLSFSQLSANLCLLHTLSDINNEKDILYLFKRFAKNIFVQILGNIFSGFRSIFSFYYHCYKQLFFLRQIAFRGPPLLLFI